MARNKYAGICYRCKEVVLKGEGHFEKHPKGWRVQHAECAIKHRELKQAGLSERPGEE